MQAFHNDEKVKQKYLKRVEAHRLADEIVHGQYWSDGKGCAVGCTIHGSEHFRYETELGIPEWLARVEDTIFEGLKNGLAKQWPERFLAAIKPGAKLDAIKTPFLIYILEQNLETLASLPDMTKFPDVKNAINLSREATIEMIRCHREGRDLSAARSAAWSAESAAWSAESAAWSARSARSAAESAARSAAESAARSAESAARSAARSAESAAEESAAWSAAYEKYADKLINLIEACT